MNIQEYADAINVEIQITRHVNKNNRWTAKFVGCEVMTNECLRGEYGTGMTPNVALLNYAEKIAGKRIALNASRDNRMEFNVPKTLTGNL